jgi:hypothetical protein
MLDLEEVIARINALPQRKKGVILAFIAGFLKEAGGEAWLGFTTAFEAALRAHSLLEK